MKKTILILSAVALTFASCKKEEVQPVVTPTTNEYIPDCDCDESSVDPLSASVGNLVAPCWSSLGTYVTINQCTGVQINGDWDNYNGGSTPYVGECR